MKRRGFVLLTVLIVSLAAVMFASAALTAAVFIFDSMDMRTELLRANNLEVQALAAADEWLASAAVSGDLFSSGDLAPGVAPCGSPVMQIRSDMLSQLAELNAAYSFDVVVTDQHYADSYRGAAGKYFIPQSEPAPRVFELEDGSTAEYASRLVNVRACVSRSAQAAGYETFCATYVVYLSNTGQFGVMRCYSKIAR